MDGGRDVGGDRGMEGGRRDRGMERWEGREGREGGQEGWSE